MSAHVRLNEQRLWQSIERLSALTRPDRPWTRRAFSPEFFRARRCLQAEFEAAGLQTRVDAAGNLIGSKAGRCPGLKPLAIGSHCDTVESGGRFDGIAGVLTGLEIARALQEQDVALNHPLMIIDFLAEEPGDHGVSCVGSRAWAGCLTADMLALTDTQGESLAQSIARVAGHAPAVASLQGPDLAAFLELHIEQGPVLEQAGVAVGVVNHIVGIQRHELVLWGRADHAGTTPMSVRQDALAGAAAVITAVQRLAHAFGHADQGPYVVATIGRLQVHPNASNVVPDKVSLILDLRSESRQVLHDFLPALQQRAALLLQPLQVRMTARQLSASDPVACAPEIMAVIEQAAQELNCSSMALPSGAGHDAVYMARQGPMGMVFVPCLEGRSHCPEEWVEPEQLLAGARVLCRSLLLLDALPAAADG